MTKELFTEILKEYEFSDHQIEITWISRPSDNVSEDKLRKSALHIKPNKDKMIQA